MVTSLVSGKPHASWIANRLGGGLTALYTHTRATFPLLSLCIVCGCVLRAVVIKLSCCAFGHDADAACYLVIELCSPLL